jgi:hypothetical protein
MQSRQPTVQFGRSARSQSRTVSISPRRRSGGVSWNWRELSWPLSIAFFAIPAALVALSVLIPRFAANPEVLVLVTDRYSGQSIAGATITLPEQTFATDVDGSALLEIVEDQVPITVHAPGYEGVSTALARGGPENWQVGLRPNVLSGRLTDADSQSGVAGADVSVIAPDGAELATVTDSNGWFAFDSVPEDATIRVFSADHGLSEESIGLRTEIDLVLEPTFIDGQITDAEGTPIVGARVATLDASVETFTNTEGSFRLPGGSSVEELLVSAAGFADQILAVDESRQIAAALQGEQIKAVYANLGVLSEPERWNRLLEIADTTEINAIVVDVKQDTIYYDTQVQFFRDIEGMVTPLFVPEELLAELDARGIYSIARMVVFKDPVVAAGRPDLAVRDDATGGIWYDMNGAPWVNAFNEELWTANAELGAELARLGFDEVQYDYIRFPSDGDLSTANFGPDYSEAARRAAIKGAVAEGAQQVRAAGAKFAIDLFPIIALLGDDQGIGQTLQDLTPLADYVCLMVYPSHYERGNIPVEGHPNDFPAETVTYTLEQSQVWAPGTIAKMRPWLQDFTYPLEGYSAYGPEDVREQIDAAEALGVSGWMLWNAAGEFQVSALAPE